MALRISRRTPEKKTPASVGLGGREKGYAMLNVTTIDEVPATVSPPKSRGSTEAQRCRLWLETRLNKVNREGSFSEWATISPALAEEILRRNPNNRKVSQVYLDRYAHDMARGHWESNGESIIISDDGLLNDGQHRLAACVQSGHPFKTLVVFGVRRSARLTTDQGRARMVGDYLSMDGVKDPNVMAATAAALLTYEKTGMIRTSYASQRPTRTDTLIYFSKNEAEIEDAVRFVSIKGSRAIASTTCLAASLILMRRATFRQHEADTFMTDIMKGADLSARSWAYVTRERLLAERGIRRTNPNHFVEIIIRGWNQHIAGKRVTRLQVSGRIPEVQG